MITIVGRVADDTHVLSPTNPFFLATGLTSPPLMLGLSTASIHEECGQWAVCPGMFYHDTVVHSAKSGLTASTRHGYRGPVSAHLCIVGVPAKIFGEADHRLDLEYLNSVRDGMAFNPSRYPCRHCRPRLHPWPHP